MNNQVLDRVAHPWSSTLGRHCNVLSHRWITALIEVQVTHPLVVLNHRNPAILCNKTDQALAPTGNDAVHIFIEGQ